jgi:hypothetical protein
LLPPRREQLRGNLHAKATRLIEFNTKVEVMIVSVLTAFFLGAQMVLADADEVPKLDAGSTGMVQGRLARFATPAARMKSNS